MATIIDGRLVAAKILEQAAACAAEMSARGINPALAVVIVGDDPASRVYVDNKKKDCAKTGILSYEYTLPADTTQSELLAIIRGLNSRKDVHGILVQLPLPAHLDEKEVLGEISPLKDVDAFHPVNVGHIMIGDFTLLPCTPAGVMELLLAYGVSTAGKHCVIIGRSNIVGKPMAMLMLKADATVTICHSKTRGLAEITRQADILVAAVGKAGFVTLDMVKPGAVVIDVGMNRNSEGRLCGDVDFEPVAKIAGMITPVPGGVGVMTRAMLMRNTLTAAENLEDNR